MPIGTSIVESLSERELQVLRVLAAGRQNGEIGDELSVALDTVKKHITHILEKLGARPHRRNGAPVSWVCFRKLPAIPPRRSTFG